MIRPPLHIHVGAARHFLGWELEHFEQYFILVDQPDPGVSLLAFGPDVIRSGSELPASSRFLIQFPGFGHNPLHDLAVRDADLQLINDRYDLVFVNPGPLEVAYSTSDRLRIFPVSINVRLLEQTPARYRSTLDSLVHVSSRTAQKDWQRSASIMKKSGLHHEVYPPLDDELRLQMGLRAHRRAALAAKVGIRLSVMPLGYVSHAETIKTYRRHDGFVHVARDVRHQTMIDGKYTAALMEAAATGAITFWHDTLSLGNDFETVFDLPEDTRAAADRILELRDTLDIKQHSIDTATEMRAKADPGRSVRVRVDQMMEVIDSR
ncbi:hypothetical protein [Microbacterium lacus]|uniref:hypothetical protein n=1 Tax=Microbacterium lacus TaxID=415217 RepID=UPI000C2B711B|nr:hypothetical protein [Microbacterium lacus]